MSNNTVNGMSIIKFMEVTSNIESCDKTRPDLKQELITLRNKIKMVMDALEKGEELPDKAISNLFDEVQLYKKYF